jgi:hypothetical protein
MLRIDRLNEDTLTLVSNDANAENVLVQDAAEGMDFPELGDIWAQAEPDENGLLCADFSHELWADLQELLEGVDAPDAPGCIEAIVQARKARDAASAA